MQILRPVNIPKLLKTRVLLSFIRNSGNWTLETSLYKDPQICLTYRVLHQSQHLPHVWSDHWVLKVLYMHGPHNYTVLYLTRRVLRRNQSIAEENVSLYRRPSSNQEVVGSIPTWVRLWFFFFTATQTCTEHSVFIYVGISRNIIQCKNVFLHDIM